MTITSRHNPLVARFRDAARGDADAVMLLDGAHLVADALAANVAIHVAVVTAAAQEIPAIHELADRLSQRGVDVVVVSPPVMDAISPVRSASAIVALADRPRDRGAEMYDAPSPLVVIAVDIQDPGNVGAIVRVAEAAGASGVVAAGASANPFGWKALRGSMGSALRLAAATAIDGAEAAADARRRGC